MRYRPLYNMNPAEEMLATEQLIEGVPPEWETFPNAWITATTQVPSFTIVNWLDLSREEKDEMLVLAETFEVSEGQDMNSIDQLIALMNEALSSTPIVDEEDEVEIESSEEGEPLTEEELNAIFTEDARTAVEDAFPGIPVESLESTDLFKVVLNTAIAMPEISGYPLSSDAATKAIRLFKFATFPTYEPQELVEFLNYANENNFEILTAEANAVLRDDTREDAMCTQRNIDLVRGAFGEEAASNFEAFCNAAPDSRIVEFRNQGGSLASIIGVDPVVFDHFVIESFDGALVEDLANDGAALRQAVERSLEAVQGKTPSETPNTVFQDVGETTTKATNFTTTNKVVTGLVLTGVLASAYALVKHSREA